MTFTSGKSVRLFLVDGSPTGVVTAEIVNWTGHALLAPRADIASVRKRSEFERTGIYFLLGEVATVSERRKVYIGESDYVCRRIEQHASSKDDDFFERFCVFTSKDANLTKAHIRYLENRLTTIASSSGRADVQNSNQPPQGTLPESDIDDMEFFISQIEIVLPVLGFDIIRKKNSRRNSFNDSNFLNDEDISEQQADGQPPGQIGLILKDRRCEVITNAILDDSDYIVLAGSTARSEAKNSFPEHLPSYSELRNSLILDGSLIAKNGSPHLLEFSRDVVFKSPSAASSVILGRADNGRRSWKVKSTGEDLAEFQNRLLKEA